MSTDTEIGRLLNALHATLNDQKADHVDPERIREIAVGTSGGEVPYSVRVEEHASRPTAAVHDEQGQRVATVRLEQDGTWTVERDIKPVDDVAIPQPESG
jgi:hypothetical protein